jgi:hypothetical protein
MWIMASELAGRVSASVPWVVVGGLLEVFTLCVSMTAVVGCGSRPALALARASEMSLGYARRAVTVEIYSGQSQRRSPPTRTAIHDQAHVRRNPRSIWSQNGRRPAFAATSIDGKSHGKRRIGCLTNRLSGQQIVECPLRCCSVSPASDVDSIVRTFLFPGGGVVVRQARAGLWCGAQRPLDRLLGAVGRSQPGRVGRRPGRGSR